MKFDVAKFRKNSEAEKELGNDHVIIDDVSKVWTEQPWALLPQLDYS